MERLQTLLEGKEPGYILPFLWMKGEDNETVKRELDRIEECGIREVCLESRPHPDFCGPGWWENLDFICGEAKRRGMRLWILDDDKFPTGHANGGFERQPEKSKLYLAERHMDICGPCRNGAVLVENFMGVHGKQLKPNGQTGKFPDEKLLGILAVPKPDGESLAVAGEGILDLTDRCENGFVYFDLPEGAYRLFVIFTTRKGGGRDSYVNLIDADSVRVLIDEVYEKHYARYREYFGSVIAGFFSDEPELGNVKGYPFDNTLGQEGRLPWSRQLEEALEKKWGEKFLENLPALWYESGEKTAAVRSGYMDEMTRLVQSCFSGQIGSWCEKRGVEYIGHIIEDDNAHARMACSIGHYFREMAGQHMAGIDVVHHQIVPGFTEPVHQWIAGDRDGEFFHFGLAKLASSAAHIQKNKRNRALCEIFGNYGWAEGNSFMKWLANHMLVRGINRFTPHAFSMRYPDPDCPPHFSAGGNNPGFACFTWLMKYMNRAAHLLDGGVHVADAAVLYHGESEWSGGAYELFQKPGRKLMEKGMDYDVVPADLFGEETIYNPVCVENGRLRIGEESYVCLILPYARYLDKRVIRFVEKSAPLGLKVFVTEALPEGDVYKAPLPESWESHVEVVPLCDIAGKVAARKEELGEKEIAADAFSEEPGAGTCGFGDLRCFLVRHRDGLAAMYFNESVCKKFCGQIRVYNPEYDWVTVYDPWQNQAECFALHETGTLKDAVPGKVPLCLEPGEAVFYCFERRGSKVQSPAHTFPAREERAVLDLDWRVSRIPQGMQEEIEEVTWLKAGRPLPNLNGPGFWPSFVGTYVYEGSFFRKKEEGKRYFLIFPEASDSMKVRLNGKELGFLAGFPARLDVTGALADGENRIRVEVATTLVWKLKDGASTHLQVPASGITQAPVLRILDYAE